jgi:hypothetical protein
MPEIAWDCCWYVARIASELDNMFNKFKFSLDKWHNFIDISFLPGEMKISYHELIRERAGKIYAGLHES